MRFISSRPFASILLLLVSLCLSILTAEFLCRCFFPSLTPAAGPRIVFERNYTELEKNWTGRMKKNTGDFNVSVATNNDGFRDVKSLATASDNDFFLIGDSFSFGYGVEETERFSNRLEKKLGLRVFNLGVPAAGVSDYAQILAAVRARGISVRKLIAAVCMENDLENPPAEGAVEPEPTRFQNLFCSLKVFLSGHSAFYQALAVTAHRHPLFEDWAARAGLLSKNLDTIEQNGWDSVAITHTAQQIARMRQDAQMWVVLIPSRSLWIGQNRETELRVHEAFAAALREEGLKVVDLRPRFEASGNPLRFHFPNDPHWTPEAHAVAAEELAAALA